MSSYVNFSAVRWSEMAGNEILLCAVLNTVMNTWAPQKLKNVVAASFRMTRILQVFNPLNAELNPICHLLALLGVHFLHVSRIRVKSLTLRLLMSYMYIWSTYS